MEQLQQLWPIMSGKQGYVAAFVAWRGAIELVVPLVNAKLQSKFTELLIASPTVANDIVQKKWYQTVALILRMTFGILLPTESSMLLHQVKAQAKAGNTETFDRSEMKPPGTGGFTLLDVLFVLGMLSFITFGLLQIALHNPFTFLK